MIQINKIGFNGCSGSRIKLENWVKLNHKLLFNLNHYLRFNLDNNLWFNLTQFSNLIRLPLHPLNPIFFIWIYFSYSIWLIIYNTIQIIFSEPIWLRYSILFDTHCTHSAHRFLFELAIQIIFSHNLQLNYTQLIIPDLSKLWKLLLMIDAPKEILYSS